jgi:sRNA-binding carbon storage regulator CsrA
MSTPFRSNNLPDAMGAIMIVMVEIRSDRARLGIQTSKDMLVHRRDVYDAIRRFDDDDAAGACVLA